MHLTAFTTLCLSTLVLSFPILQKRDTLERRDPDLEPSRCPDFCAGTQERPDQYQPDLPLDDFICRDSRLGPVALPTGIPLEGIVGMNSTYRRFGGLCPGQWLSKYWDEKKDALIYPPDDGFAFDTAGEPIMFNMTVEPGQVIDRFGPPVGKYAAPAGAPYAQRALSASNLNAAPDAKYPYNYHVYTVVESFVVLAGPIAPWFGQQGLGLQYKLAFPLQNLIDEGKIVEVDLVKNPNW